MRTPVLLRLQRLGLLALLVLLLGQAALLAHKVTVVHTDDTACELCTHFDRLVASSASLAAGLLIVAALRVAGTPAVIASPARPVFGYLLRGPPSL